MGATRGRSDDDFSSEIESHLELETARLVADGMRPEDARLAARRRFGSVAAAKERFYESQRRLWLDHLLQDVRVAARNLLKYPMSSLVAVVSLAGGIGATTVTLIIRDVVFRKPPALYRDAAQLSRVQVGSPDRPIRGVGNPVPARLSPSCTTRQSAARWRRPRPKSSGKYGWPTGPTPRASGR
jgi:hypothetical protein